MGTVMKKHSTHSIDQDPGFKGMYNITPGNKLAPAVTEKSVQREMNKALDVAMEKPLLEAPKDPIKKSKGLKKLAAVAVAGVTVVGGIGVGKKIIESTESDKKAEQPTVPYIVQPGDTAWDIAKNVEANIDRVADNQDVRPFVDEIMEQARQDGNPGLQSGEVIQLPEAADRHLDPGYQDSSK